MGCKPRPKARGHVPHNGDGLIRKCAAFVLCCLLPLFLAIVGIAVTPARSDEPVAPLTVTVTHTVTSSYRGRSATHWASAYKHRTLQYQHARRAARQAIRSPVYGRTWLESAFLCIHGFEGSWTDPSAPFWGGLQMDSSFQQTYGSWAVAAFGTADHWPVSVQIATAIRAYESGRGFHPWPNTARYCGLI